MAVDSIQSSLFNPASAPAAGEARTPQRTLGQDDFLRLLLMQLTRQDPLNPTKDTEFIAQMATFSTLEQSKQMQSNMAQMQANALIGREVQVQNEKGEKFTGLVTGVRVKAGVPEVLIEDKPYALSQVIGIAEPEPVPPPVPAPDPAVSDLLAQTRGLQTYLAQTQANSLLGRTVQIKGADGPPLAGVVSAVHVKAGMPQVVVNGHSYDLGQVLTITESSLP